MVNLLIFETEFWSVAHRKDSRYPGYLMVSSVLEVSELCHLPGGALLELGEVLAKTEHILRRTYSPHKVIIAKLGFSQGFSCHFHMIPTTVNLLHEIAKHPAYSNEPDGNDAMLFVSREYCERELSDEEKHEMRQVVAELREFSKAE